MPCAEKLISRAVSNRSGTSALKLEIFYFRFSEMHGSVRVIPPRSEGRTRRHGRRAGCDGRGLASSDEGCGRRTAKACGPDLPTLGSTLRAQESGGTVAIKPGHRGERAISRKPLRREGRTVSAYLYSLVCFLRFLPRTRGCGCGWHPAFPAPSLSLRVIWPKPRANPAARALTHARRTVSPRHKTHYGARPIRRRIILYH